MHRKEGQNAILHHNLTGLKQEMQGLSKLNRISNKECRYMQSYRLEKSLQDSRLEFRWRYFLQDCRAWMPGIWVISPWAENDCKIQTSINISIVGFQPTCRYQLGSSEVLIILV